MILFKVSANNVRSPGTPKAGEKRKREAKDKPWTSLRELSPSARRIQKVSQRVLCPDF